jgi:hypothetical protein
MLEVLQFIFSGFWIWLGTLMLVGTIGAAVARIVLAVWGVKGGD